MLQVATFAVAAVAGVFTVTVTADVYPGRNISKPQDNAVSFAVIVLSCHVASRQSFLLSVGKSKAKLFGIKADAFCLKKARDCPRLFDLYSTPYVLAPLSSSFAPFQSQPSPPPPLFPTICRPPKKRKQKGSWGGRRKGLPRIDRSWESLEQDKVAKGLS